ncbi:MAG: UvrD-helicase domain-containing protein [Oligoflexia bacterium]|nr:UvrD-helicase domain-containing protein [Oligoflexia bacterium]
MVDLTNLNRDQKAAVLHTDGPVMVLAGAGSGKTRTLVTRISYLLEDKRISPFRILALTFSNKAAREMRERIASEVNEDLGALQITTFHAFCARVLRQEAQYLGLSKNFTIYDTSESKAIAKSILQKRGISTKETSPFEILYFMDDLKNNGYYRGRESDYFEADEDDPFFDYYLEYEAELHRANAVDFGGLITGVLQLFEKFPEVLQRYQERYQYILVDEYQDTNRAQFDLLTLLIGNNDNICVVGDEDQSIYSWRGADINNILDFEKRFPNAEVLKLEQNYRSSKTIIEAASHVISRNSLRKGKEMWTDNKIGDVIEIVECHNDKKEGEFVTDTIKSLASQGKEYRDMAVFYRANSQSRIIEDYLRKANIPYKVVGGVKFYERKEIKDLLAYLRIVVNPKDNLAISRIINVPTRGIGATSLRKLEDEAVKHDMSLFESIENISDHIDQYKHLRFSAKVKSGLRSFANLIQELQVLDKEGIKPSVIYEKALHESGYFDFLKASKDYESIARLENLEELGSALKQYEESTKSPNLTGFLETITLDTSSDEDRNLNTGEVSLMTIHGAKGLEFGFVFVTGAEENVFPSYKSLESGQHAEEEERRLFYVAMTRAMEKLFITFAQGRMLFGQLKFNGPSRFIHEIPSKFYHWKKETSDSSNNSFMNQRSFGDQDDDWDFNQETSYDDGEVVYQVNGSESQSSVSTTPDSKFPTGSKVVHSLYGEGKVLDTEGFGSEEKVVIKFNDGARKKFMVKFAPLTLLT